MAQELLPVISIFSGAGGLSLGLAETGLKPLIGVDIDPDACATYTRNIGPCLQEDISYLDSDKLLRSLGLRRGGVFMLAGGPPCQGFSSAGGKKHDDPRNRLVWAYLALLDAIRPEWFFFENVEGLLTWNRGRSLYELTREFLSLGYWIRIEKVNAAAYGLPQSRKRVLILGNRRGLDFSLPSPTHSFRSGRDHYVGPTVTAPSVMDALGDLPPPEEKPAVLAYPGPPLNPLQEWLRRGCDKVTLHWASKVSDADRKRFAELRPGGTMRDLPQELWHPSYQRRAFRRVMDGTPSERRGGPPAGLRRLVGHEPSKTITGTSCSEFVHPVDNRHLTLRECARLQSFPDWYEFEGNVGSIARQIGNAVPPLLAFVVARHILEVHLQDRRAAPGSPRGRLLGFTLTVAGQMSPALESTYAYLSSLLEEDPAQAQFRNQLFFDFTGYDPSVPRPQFSAPSPNAVVAPD